VGALSKLFAFGIWEAYIRRSSKIEVLIFGILSRKNGCTFSCGFSLLAEVSHCEATIRGMRESISLLSFFPPRERPLL